MTVTIKNLVEKLHVKVQHGEEFLDREILTSELSRPGVALTGYFEFYDSSRIQVIGRTETSFIEQMPYETAAKVMAQLCCDDTPAFIMARNIEAPAVLVEAAKNASIPIIQSPAKTTSVISNLTNYLESVLAERTSVHGVFVDVFGVGVLITGQSGVGKSETALDLIKNGHRLIADDRVDFYQIDELTLMGEAPQILKNLLEVRGIGIIDVMSLFGVGSVVENKRLDVIIRLEIYDETKTFDRLGNQQETLKIIDVDVPLLKIPVKLGRNLANIIEVATMNFRAKEMGYDATETFQNNLEKLIKQNTKEG